MTKNIIETIGCDLGDKQASCASCFPEGRFSGRGR